MLCGRPSHRCTRQSRRRLPIFGAGPRIRRPDRGQSAVRPTAGRVRSREGSGVLVLERTDHADARGASGYADICGWGGTTDAFHPVTPRADGAHAAECMRRAIADADLEPSDVDYVNAHGTGTKVGDTAEATAIRTVFRDSPAVSSIKAATGHTLGASGAVEAVTTALTVSTGTIPPTRNLDDPSPDCALDHVRGPPAAARSRRRCRTCLRSTGTTSSRVSHRQHPIGADPVVCAPLHDIAQHCDRVTRHDTAA